MKLAIAAAATAGTFLVLDLIWLGVVMRDFYREQMGPLMADPFNIPAAVAFYALMVLGVTVFVSAPALASGTWWDALLWGALFGLVAYGTYDLTNLATLRNWPVTLTFVDMAWGAVVTGLSAAAGVFAAERFG